MMEAKAPRRPLMTAEETAPWLNIRLHRLYDLAREGRIPVVRFGRQMRFDPEALEKWLEGGGTGYESPEAA